MQKIKTLLINPDNDRKLTGWDVLQAASAALVAAFLILTVF